jgi:predicted MPP superfamily phosphohydrolase
VPMRTTNELPAHRGQICALSWSCDGNRLLSASYDGEIRVWDIVANRSIVLSKRRDGNNPADMLFTASWAFNDEMIAASFGRRLILLDSSDGDIRRQVDRPASLQLIGSRRETLFAPILVPDSGGQYSTIEELKLSSLEPIRACKERIYELHRIALSPDEETIVVQAYDGIELLRTHTLKELGIVKPARGIATDAVWLTKRSFAVGCSDGNIRVYECIPDGSEPFSDRVRFAKLYSLEMHEAYISRLSYSPGQFLLVSLDLAGTLHAWGGECLRYLDRIALNVTEAVTSYQDAAINPVHPLVGCSRSNRLWLQEITKLPEAALPFRAVIPSSQISKVMLRAGLVEDHPDSDEVAGRWPIDDPSKPEIHSQEILARETLILRSIRDRMAGFSAVARRAIELAWSAPTAKEKIYIEDLELAKAPATGDDSAHIRKAMTDFLIRTIEDADDEKKRLAALVAVIALAHASMEDLKETCGSESPLRAILDSQDERARRLVKQISFDYRPGEYEKLTDDMSRTLAALDSLLQTAGAIDEMKKLRDQVVTLKESSRATSEKVPQVERNERLLQTLGFTHSDGYREEEPQPKDSPTRNGPRVYISYSWRTKGLKQRALKLAEKLWASEIDTRIDLFYAKSLHGFLPPDPLPDRDCWEAWQEEQIKDSDFVLLICTKEYFGSPRSSGAWRDMNFMQQALQLDKTKRRRFIPVGFATHQAVEPFIPEFIRGANYYNLATTAQTGFGFTDLVRRLKTEFAAANIQSTQSIQNYSPSVRPSNGGKVFMKSRTITWLHLSDLHNCKERTGWDAHRVLRPLVTDLKTMEKEHDLLPQMIFFTGDAAFGNIGEPKGSTMREQFDGAHELLEQVRRTFLVEIAKENVFIVPGNHDVDRTEVTQDQTSWLKAQTEALVVNDLLHKAGKQWQRYMDRLKIYQESLARYGYDHLLNDQSRLIYAQTRSFHGLDVGIAGFNSAWACGGDGEKGHLWFGGDWQSGELTEKLSGADFRLALMHHPFGWFVEAEDAPLKILFERDFAFHLHGHEHLGWVDAKADGHVRIAAAACYDRSNIENGYNFVRLNLETGEGEVWLRRYDSQGGGWVPRVVARKTTNDGLWQLRKLSWLESLVARKLANP